MFDNLTGVAYGLVVFAIVIGAGIVILNNFGTVGCSTNFPIYNSTNGRCMQINDSSLSTTVGNATNYSTPGAATGIYTVGTYLGTGSGGLVTWVPAIIALIIGVLFIAMLMNRQKKY